MVYVWRSKPSLMKVHPGDEVAHLFLALRGGLKFGYGLNKGAGPLLRGGEVKSTGSSFFEAAIGVF